MTVKFNDHLYETVSSKYNILTFTKGGFIVRMLYEFKLCAPNNQATENKADYTLDEQLF